MNDGRLTTHVLDTASGRPAAGMAITLYRCDKNAEPELLRQLVTNNDGRAPSALLEGDAMTAGAYELRFAVGDYFAAAGHADARRFLDVVPIAFRIEDADAHYHVPLLVSPWAYSTYRGS